jgi:CHASE3 domain sensor protein
MNKKILNILLFVSLLIIIYTAVVTYDSSETIDALTGATPTNDVLDAISGASEEHEEDDD